MWLIFSLSTYIVIVVVHTANAFLEQSVRVRGRLLCGSQPASSILVKLFDKDNGPNPDDLLDSCYTDSGGKFDLQGNSYELSTIDPEPCQREWVIRIPDRYVSNGAVARKTMELGEMNLEVELEDEDQECIHH
uniref:Transthyretin-like family protein n=1 Tax=Wuchereria bancrofti TaxID=6293 RepID=A0AAF5PGZ6_WUCBA